VGVSMAPKRERPLLHMSLDGPSRVVETASAHADDMAGISVFDRRPVPVKRKVRSAGNMICSGG